MSSKVLAVQPYAVKIQSERVGGTGGTNLGSAAPISPGFCRHMTGAGGAHVLALTADDTGLTKNCVQSKRPGWVGPGPCPPPSTPPRRSCCPPWPGPQGPSGSACPVRCGGGRRWEGSARLTAPPGGPPAGAPGLLPTGQTQGRSQAHHGWGKKPRSHYSQQQTKSSNTYNVICKTYSWNFSYKNGYLRA